MKWLLVIVVAILAAPTIAKRLQELNPDNADKQASSADIRKRGLVYRAVRRFGPRAVGIAVLVVVVAVAIGAYLLLRALGSF